MSDELRSAVSRSGGGADGGDGILYPLTAARAALGQATPEFVQLTSDDLPEPSRSLLNHDHSMTAVLERHCREDLQLRTLASFTEGTRYVRLSILETAAERPVELGALSIELSEFPLALQEAILHNTVPLGRLLRDCWHEYRSVPTAFFALRPDDATTRALQLAQPALLYGRRTRLWHYDHQVADIVEIVRPV